MANSMTPESLLRHLRNVRGIVDRTSYRIQIVPSIDQEFVRTLIENQEELLRIAPRKFEELVATLLLADGWEEVQLVSRINAPGPDIIAFGTHSDYVKQKLIVECKRWKNVVGIDVVRTIMYWANWEYHADSALIACSSRFTRSAVAQRDRFHRWNLDLKDQHSMLMWMKTHLNEISSTDTLAVFGLEVQDLSQDIESLLLERASQQNSSTFIRPVGIACQRCGGQLYCATASTDLGALDYYRDFGHVCIDCRWSQYEMEHDSNLGGGPNTGSYEYCPMCHRRYDDLL
jgi:hypothetical protein